MEDLNLKRRILLLAFGILLVLATLLCTPGTGLPPIPKNTASLTRSADLVHGETGETTAPAPPGLERTRAPESIDMAGILGALRVHCSAANETAPAPLQGAWVSLYSSGEAVHASHLGMRVDANGDALFEGISAGTWTVIAYAGIHEVKQIIDVAPAGRHRVELVFKQMPSIDVTVVDESAAPVPDADVWVGFGTIGRISPFAATTRLAGRTDIQGHIRLQADARMHIGARHDRYACSLARPFRAIVDGKVTLTLRNGPGVLAGLVLDEEARPLYGEPILVQAIDSSPSIHSPPAFEALPVPVFTWTDSFGYFVLPGLAPGRYRCLLDTTRLCDPVDVTIASGSRIDIRLLCAPTIPLVVQVTHEDGQPAAGLRLSALQRNGNQIPLRSLPTIGHFSARVPPGECRLLAHRLGRKVAETTIEANPDAPPLRWVIDEPLSVSGQLVDVDGIPIPGWHVVAADDTSTITHSAFVRASTSGARCVTDAQGAFSLFGLGSGPFLVAAQADWTSWHELGPPVLRHAVASGTRNLRLVAPPNAIPRFSLTGRIIDAQATPLANAAVRVLRTSPPVEAALIDGRFRINKLTPGLHHVFVRAPGFADRVLEVSLQTESVDLGDIPMHPDVPVRVRLVLPTGTAWPGPIPHPRVLLDDGSALEPQPLLLADGPYLRISGLACGRYHLTTAQFDDLVADPLPFELTPLCPLQLDWNVQIGRRVTLRFAAPSSPRTEQDRLIVVVRSASGRETVVRDIHPDSDNHFSLRHFFATGQYSIQAHSSGGAHWEAPAVSTQQLENGGTYDVPIKL